MDIIRPGQRFGLMKRAYDPVPPHTTPHQSKIYSADISASNGNSETLHTY